MNAWLETDEYQEVIATLRAARKFVDFASSDTTYWKWVIIALHNAVQGCMVIALTRSDGFGAIDPKQELAWKNADLRHVQPPPVKEKLLSFMKLFEKIQRKGTIQISSAERFIPTRTQDCSMRKLCEIRDDFVHFAPKGWHIQLSGAPLLAVDCLDVARFLATNSDRFRLFSNFREGELIDLIDDLRVALIKLREKQRTGQKDRKGN